MALVEKIDQPRVLAFDHADLQGLHEAAHGQPEVVADHDQALDADAVALPQGLDQFRVFLAAVRVEPLLELVDHQEHLVARREALPAAEGRQDFDQAELVVQARATAGGDFAAGAPPYRRPMPPRRP